MNKQRKKYLGNYTITEAAEIIGVSPATVSRILNNKIAPDSDASRKLMKFLHTHGINYNRIKNKSKGNIYMVCDFAGDETSIPASNFPYIYKALQSRTEMAGYNLVHSDRKGINPILASDRGNSVKGVIFHCEPFPLTKDVPAVTINHDMFIDGMNFVQADLTSGFIKALKYLKENGHERVAFFFPGDKNESFFPSYIKFMPFIYQMAGFDWDENLFWGESFGYDQHQPVISRAVSHFLKMKRPPTAIVLSNDFYAMGFYSEIHLRGIRIPDDISIIGYMDSPMCKTLPIPLSSIRICPDAIAQETISIINDNLANPQTSVRKVSISPELVIRESVRRI